MEFERSYHLHRPTWWQNLKVDLLLFRSVRYLRRLGYTISINVSGEPPVKVVVAIDKPEGGE